MKIVLALLLNFATLCLAAQEKTFHIKSPDGKIDMAIQAGSQISWAVNHQNTKVIVPSAISLTLDNSEILGKNVKVLNSRTEFVNSVFQTPFYKKSQVVDTYNQLTLNFKGNYGLIARAYNDGVAYRFVLKRPGQIVVKHEEANFNFPADEQAFIPYVRDIRNNDPYIMGFEALYQEEKLSHVADTLTFLPQMMNVGEGKKAVILEADLEDYPGMFLKKSKSNNNSMESNFAMYPLAETAGGFNNFNYVVTKRANYIAKINGTRTLPWRAVVISEHDKELTNNDMVQKLSSPSRIADVSWIKPGKVAWDWWNDWNITKVDFEAGINNATYKYYIDFAAANKLEYIIIDEGWSQSADMTKISPKINLQQLIDYGKQKNVGVILWASWYALNKVMDGAFAQYANMGVKGFKVDFLERDDQKMVASVYEIAQKAAKYKLLVDFHGMYKPTGVQRTYPNVINFEAVKGMENVKWTPNDDMPRYDATIPFIRMLAGPMDYTPGAMRNTNRNDFKPSNSQPVSQGTRCHQMAMYVVFEAPLQMLCDNPTAYIAEQECTNFISGIPTVFDRTEAIDGKVGAYVAIARKKNDNWYIGALNNWDAKQLTLDLSFLGSGNYEAEVFKDGVNAQRNATDYRKEVIRIPDNKQVIINMSNGGGWVARVYSVK